MPGFAHFAAAANMRDGHGNAAVDQAENIGIETNVVGRAVRAVGSEIHGAFAVLFGVLQMHYGNRDLDAIGSGRVNLLDLIFRAVVTAGDFFLLQQSGLAGGDVVFEHRTRSDKGLIAVTEFSGVEFLVDPRIAGVSRLGKFDAMRLAGGQVGHAELRQAIFALAQNVKSLEEVRVVEHDVGAMRNHFLPVRALGIGNRGLDQAKIPCRCHLRGCRKSRRVFGEIFDVLLTRLEDFPVRVGLACRNVTGLRSGVAAGK